MLVLEAVHVFAHVNLPTQPALVVLVFGELTVYVGIDDEYDTLLLSRALPESFVLNYTVALSTMFWDSLIQQSLTEAWQMTNDRGYMDGLQLQFREHANEGAYTIVQLYGVVSTIDICELRPVRTDASVRGLV